MGGIGNSFARPPAPRKSGCWLTRHHWLLQGEQPIAFYAENNKTAESYYYYECQICGELSREIVVNLDNAPNKKEL